MALFKEQAGYQSSLLISMISLELKAILLQKK